MTNSKEQYWSRFAAGFDTGNNYVIGESDINIFLNKTDSFEKLGKTIELGCGTGIFTARLAKNCTTVLATDLSNEMIAVARVKLKNFTNVKVEKADCFNINHPDNSFDTVFMSNLLHVILHPENALDECRRILKPDGQLIVLSYTTKEMPMANKLRIMYRYFKTYGKPPKGGQNFRLSKATEMIEACGFKTISQEIAGQMVKAIIIKAVKQQ